MSAENGPAFLANGFRPFFFFASLWAAMAMGLWIPMLEGAIAPPTAFDAISWHAHEALFGYLGAVLAGFALTAAPNWTGRPPLRGAPLAALVALWIAGRLAVTFSEGLPPAPVAAIDLSGLAAVAAYLLREIVAGKNWRNLVVVVAMSALIAANGVFHWEAARGEIAASGYGLRFGFAAAIMLIVLIGGRIAPAFTRNWLAKTGRPGRPAEMGAPDKAAILVMLLALALWVAAPEMRATGAALLVAAALQVWRLYRWRGAETLSEPLVWVLHAGYGFVPLGAAALGFALLWPSALDPVAGQHLWMAGAIGLMTMAVMTRATLGHTGRPLTAGPGTTALYLAIVAAAFARFAAGLIPGQAQALYHLAGGLWCAAFLGFALLYGPTMFRPRGADAGT